MLPASLGLFANIGEGFLRYPGVSALHFHIPGWNALVEIVYTGIEQYVHTKMV